MMVEEDPKPSLITVTVELAGRHKANLRWASTSSDEAVASLVCGAVDLPRDSSIILKDSEGFLVPCCSQLTSGESYEVVQTSGSSSMSSLSSLPPSLSGTMIPPGSFERAASAPVIPQPISGSSQPLLDNQRVSVDVGSAVDIIQPIIENRMTKFERLTTHLANERTYLAWVRTSVSVIGLSVTYANLAAQDNAATFWTGCCFAWFVGLAIFGVGTSRYYKVKEVLGLPKSAITNRFERTGINYIVGGFGAFLAAMTAEYLHSLYRDMNE